MHSLMAAPTQRYQVIRDRILPVSPVEQVVSLEGVAAAALGAGHAVPFFDKFRQLSPVGGLEVDSVVFLSLGRGIHSNGRRTPPASCYDRQDDDSGKTRRLGRLK